MILNGMRKHPKYIYIQTVHALRVNFFPSADVSSMQNAVLAYYDIGKTLHGS